MGHSVARVAKRLLRGCLIGIALLFACLCLALVLFATIAEPDGGRSGLIVGVCSGASLFPLVGLHEVGHLIGGRLAGFRFAFFVVGPLRFTRGPRGIQIRWTRMPESVLGLAVSLPTDDRDLRRRLAVMLAGGPAANLIAALFAFALDVGLGPHPVDRAWLGLVLSTVGAWSLFHFLISIVPSGKRGVLTDGAKLLSLLRGGPEAERHCAIAALTGSSLGGTRPRDWQPELLKVATSLPDGSASDATAALLAYRWALDRGDVERAGEFLDRALAGRQKLPAISRPALFLEAAYFTARHSGDAIAARAFLAQGKGGAIIEPCTRLRAEAAVLLAEGDRIAAQQRATEAFAAIDCRRDSLGASVEADWLREILALSAADPSLPMTAPKESE
jgi:hypothetical protein